MDERRETTPAAAETEPLASETPGVTIHRALSLLIVDDSPSDRETYRRFLAQDSTHRYEIHEAESAEQTLSILADRQIDCLLLDYELPDATGIELLDRMAGRDGRVDLPVVMLTGRGSETIATEAMKRGSQDYVGKDALTPRTLTHAIHNAVERIALRREVARQAVLEEARRQQLEFKDTFLSHVSHELRTPLAVVHQFLLILLDGLAGDLSDEQREHLGIAFRNTVQLKQMIADLMDATRVRAGKVRVDQRPLELTDLIVETVRGLAAEAQAKEVSLEAEIEPELPTVLADDPRVRQILYNLIENAIKFTPEEGSIRLLARLDPETPDFVRVSVVDTGCGISAAGVQHIFDQLHQEESEEWEARRGLGLGLYICHELVVRQGGRIWVESKLHQGSAFHFTLPCYSLSRLIAPALAVDGRLRESFGLVRVDLTPAAVRETPTIPEGLLRQALYFVRTMIYPDVDVLLPRYPRRGRTETFLVVAGTDETGLTSLVQRIQKKLSEDDGLARAKVQVFVEGRVEETSEEDRAASVDEGVARIAARIEKIRSLGGWRN